MRKWMIAMISAAALLFSARAQAINPPNWMQFSIDWGYSQQAYMHTHFNYITDEGYRVDEAESGFSFFPNGRVGASVSFLTSDFFTVGLELSYLGCGSEERMYPLLLKAAWFPRSYYEDGLFLHADAGVSFMTSQSSRKLPVMAELGPGYHVILGGRFSVDFKLDLRASYLRPLIPNSSGTGYIEERNTRRNNALYCALDFSIAVNF